MRVILFVFIVAAIFPPTMSAANWFTTELGHHVYIPEDPTCNSGDCPSHGPCRNGAIQNEDGTTNCACMTMVGFNVVGTGPVGFSVTGLIGHYGGTVDTQLLRIGEDGCYIINIYWAYTEWTTVWEGIAGDGARSRAQANSETGQIQPGGYIVVNLEEYTYGDEGDGTLADLYTQICHEIGHIIGFNHSTSSSDLMYKKYTLGNSKTFQPGEQTEAAGIYAEQYYCECKGGNAPAFFGDVKLESESGQGAVLSFSTLLEVGVREIVVKRGSGFAPAYDDYIAVGMPIELNSPDGGSYSFVDPDGEAGDPYLLECVKEDGGLDNPLYISCGYSVPSSDYSQAALSEMIGYNLGKITHPRWGEIAAGTRTVRSISSTLIPVACDYLIVAYEDFIEEIAPICDYWQTQGFDVELVSCNGQDDSADELKRYIAWANDQNPLQFVWLVGSPTPRESDEPYTINLVPTDYSKKDHYFCDLNDDGFMDLSVGRLPARASREVVFYVNKELHYHWDSSWGGKKDPRYFSKHQVNVIPDNHACQGCLLLGEEKAKAMGWTEGQYQVGISGGDVYNIVAGSVGDDNTESLLSTSLFEWYDGDDALYDQAVKAEVFSDLEDGRHVVFGLSLHNSYTTQYGVFGSHEWPAGICMPGDVCWRPCDTFWFTPECFSTYLGSNVRGTVEEPPYLNQLSVPAIELFQNRGLLIFGSAGPTWHTTTHEVITRFAGRVFVEDALSGHNQSIGSIWEGIYNELKSEYTLELEGLSDFGIFGDPALFVRGVYSETSSVTDVELPPLHLSSTPNPFNGQVQFQVGGLAPGGGGLRVYDLKGRLVNLIHLPQSSGSSVVFWDGNDFNDRELPSGVYFIVATNQGRRVTQKIAYIK